MWKRFLTLASAGLLLTACQPSIVRPEAPRVAEAKLAPCPKLAELQSGSHNAVERWAVDTASKYHECSDRFSELAETVRAQQGASRE